MALVLGTDCGFVTTAPTGTPSYDFAASNQFGAAISIVGSTSQSDATNISEVGWFRVDTGGADVSYSVGLYEDTSNGGVTAGNLLYSSTGHSSTATGWIVVNGLNWDISSNTKYWIALWIGGTTPNTTFGGGLTDDAEGRDSTLNASLANPYPGNPVGWTQRAYSIYALTDATPPPGENIYVNVDDVHKQVAAVYVNVDDVWKEVTDISVNVDDAWKTV